MLALFAMLLELQVKPMFWVYVVILVVLIALLLMRRKARKAKN